MIARALTFLFLLAVPLVAAASELHLDGAMTQGSLIRGSAPPGTRAWLNGEPVGVSPEGLFAFGFGRDAAPEARLVLEYPDGTRDERTLTVAARDYRIQRIDGLPQEKVTPPEDVLARIHAEAARVRKARARDTDGIDFAAPFIWPADGPISGVYGSQRILNGEPRQPHYGVDVVAPEGTPVRAPAGGTVSLVELDLYFSGGTLMIDHGHGVSSAFLHLSRIDVEPGQRVEQGDLIGAIGATGRVTGAHLDWRMNWFEERVDPALLVEPRPSAQ